MKITKTNFKDLLIIQSKKYDYNRGYFRELINEKQVKSKFKFFVVS